MARKPSTPKKPRTTAAKTTAPVEAAPVEAAPATDGALVATKADPAARVTVSAAASVTAPTSPATTAPARAVARDAVLPREAIARRAHQLWLQRGAPFGDPAADWLRAERELRAPSTARPAQ